jgi:nitrate/nitrite transport system substrate-binding protein
MRASDRRDFLRMAMRVPVGIAAAHVLAACGGGAASGAAGTGGSSSGAASGGSGKPIKIGFIALTDCASVVMAQELGYFKERGLTVEVLKQASWPATRDNLLNGEIDAAHALFSLPLSLAAGIGGRPDQVLKIAMVLSNNGQAITLRKELSAAGYGDLGGVKRVLVGRQAATLAMTFPGDP